MALEIKGLFNPTSVSIPTSHLAEIMDGGEEPTDSFTVTKNLSHCAISNEQIGEASYYAEIAPTGGWSDLQVTIKVGGVDMSEYYSSGVISIPNVTGNIVITATAAAAPLVSITATYTQSGTVYDTDSLDSLKADLVVTANYDNSTSEVVTTYTLSGTLTEGTSTITVAYGGKTTTFSVTVTDSALANPILNYKFSDITLSSGYIGDDGNVVASDENYYYDEFIDAVGFWLVGESGVYYNNANLYLRLASYNGSKSFTGRQAVQRGNPAVNTNASYIKMGYNNPISVSSNSDRFVACNLLDTSICTMAGKTINASGDVEDASTSSVSDFLPVKEGVIVCQLVESHDSALVVFYDENKALISRNAVTSNLTNKQLVITVPSNAKYVRFRCETNPNDNTYVSYRKL